MCREAIRESAESWSAEAVLSQGEDERYLYCERSAGRFARTLELPDSVDADRVEATLKLGALEITLPKERTTAVKKAVVIVCKGE